MSKRETRRGMAFVRRREWCAEWTTIARSTVEEGGSWDLALQRVIHHASLIQRGNPTRHSEVTRALGEWRDALEDAIRAVKQNETKSL